MNNTKKAVDGQVLIHQGPMQTVPARRHFNALALCLRRPGEKGGFASRVHFQQAAIDLKFKHSAIESKDLDIMVFIHLSTPRSDSKRAHVPQLSLGSRGEYAILALLY